MFSTLKWVCLTFKSNMGRAMTDRPLNAGVTVSVADK